MSTAGILNRSRAEHIRSERRAGFTLIEMTMVIFLMGIILSIALPRLRDVALSDNLKNTVRTMNSTVKEIRYQAIKDNREYLLKFDFESKAFWSDSPSLTEVKRALARENSISLPSDVNVIDISFKDGEKKTAGEVSISFSKEGYISPSVIHLGADDGRRFTYILRPFLGDTDIIEDYVEIGDVTL
jgi:prepilin-type N-terminal cleavage/methylation domain-containing protein